MKTITMLLTAAQLLALVHAQSSCPAPSGSIRPSVASGYALQVVASGLSEPRGLAFDDQGHLLVVEQDTGTVSSHVVSEENGCTTLGESTTVIEEGLNLNHGIWVDGTTLYASNRDAVYSWTYDPAGRTVSDQEELINGMNNSGHTTRTLLLSQQVPGMMVVSRGSQGNLDPNSITIEGGTAQVRAFNLNNRTGIYDWQEGLLLAWGVRNEVGLVEHPVTGGIFGIENSADQITRAGVDVSNDNPGEELNFFGYLNGTGFGDQGAFFGYPWCLAVWNTEELPDSEALSVGDQFAFDQVSALNNQNQTDEFCQNEAVAPRLTFQGHMAPLDIKFNSSGSELWIPFHGSWDREDGVGYKLSLVQFGGDGQPIAAPDSVTAAIDIVSNQDLNECPENCLRPVAAAFDAQGRIFMSSDSSGEIYMVTRTENPNGTTPTGDLPATSSETSTGFFYGPPSLWFCAILTFVMFMLF